jgi:hypothetical protein
MSQSPPCELARISLFIPINMPHNLHRPSFVKRRNMEQVCLASETFVE